MKTLVVLMTGAKNDVECFTVALASAEALRSCFRLRTDDVQLAACRVAVTDGGSPLASETSVALVLATFSVFTFLDFASASSRRVIARHCRCARVTSVIQGVGMVLVTSVNWFQHAVLSSHSK